MKRASRKPRVPGKMDERSRSQLVDALFARTRTLDGQRPDLTIRAARPLPAFALGDADHPVEIGDVFARGGTSVLRAAEQRSLQRTVAVKMLQSTRRSPANVAALVHEAQLTGSLEHPNIVPVHMLGVDDDGVPYLIMKRVEGVSWRTLIRDPQHELWQGLRARGIEGHIEILLGVSDALRFAHSRGVLHRDVKPENVMVGAFGEVYLVDWGVAVSLGDDSGSELAGTPAYMAPEMLDSEARLSERTDVYLLGACLHEVLVGRPRHDGDALQSVLAAAARSEPFDFPTEVPAELAAICNRACHVDPTARFASVEALRDSLQQFQRHRASVRSAEAARAQAEEMSAALERNDDIALRRSFDITRFGYRRALEEWPQNPVAHEGLREAVMAMVAHEVEVGDGPAARRLLLELTEVPPELEARVLRAEQESRKRQHAQAELDRLHANMQIRGQDWKRSASILVSGVGTLLALLLGGALARSRGGQPSFLEMAGFVGVGLLANSIGLYLFGDIVRSSRLYTQLANSVHALAIAILALAAAFSLTDMSIHGLGVGLGVIGTAIGATLALTVDRILWISAVCGVACTLAATQAPNYAIEVGGVFFLINSLCLATVLYPKGVSSR